MLSIADAELLRDVLERVRRERVQIVSSEESIDEVLLGLVINYMDDMIEVENLHVDLNYLQDQGGYDEEKRSVKGRLEMHKSAMQEAWGAMTRVLKKRG